ncbi:hypothetical protein EXIGLDRAFT_842580, partial [Exidia glandulosa HHB12029]
MADMQSTQVRPHVDLESLLWDMREILRSLSQVSRAQSAEIERLGGSPWEGARELQERADGAVANCDSALAEWDNEDTESSIGGRVDVAAWLEATRALEEVDAGDHTGDLSFVSASSSFWKPSGFNWADEPATDDEENSMKPVPELLHDLDSHSDSASDSDESYFLTPELLVHRRPTTRESEAGETACDVDDNAMVRPARRYSFSDVVHPNFELIDVEETKKMIEDEQPVKGIPFPTLPPL